MGDGTAARRPATTLSMAALVLAMHAALLLWWSRLPDAATSLARPEPVQVRLLGVALDQALQTPAERNFKALQDRPRASIDRRPSGEVDRDASASVPLWPGSSELAAALNEMRWHPRPDELAYLPASQLDQRPLLDSGIVLPFPPGESLPQGTRVSAVLVLYVSENGDVNRIEFGQSALPPAFARVAVDAFAHVHLRPGIKNGRPRRAMMKIEVEFEAPDPDKRISGAVLQARRSWEER